jgi:hypothetical protein
MTAREDLEQEIRRLLLIIETNQAALRLRTVSKVAQLLQALDQRKTRLALLKERLAAVPESNQDTTKEGA